jgi:hypothetical protein
MTVWVITDRGNEILGICSSEAVAFDSLTYSYHKRHVRIERAPTLHRVNDWQVTIFENEVEVDHVRIYEEAVHSSRTHL